MGIRRLIASALSSLALLGAAPALAQGASPAEISFWESVRDSRNPAELQAYIDQYPNGAFVVLAKSRLAALQKPASAPTAPVVVPAAPVASTAPVVSGPPHKLQAGDTWVYRFSVPRLRGQWGQTQRPPATHTVTLERIDGLSMVDQVSVDGATPISRTHAASPELVPQGAAVFSPYLVAQRSLQATGRLGSVRMLEPECDRTYICEAKARIAGKETVSVPAGKFDAFKVIVDQEWRPRAMSGQSAGRYTGGRTLTVWYAAETGRAVKYSSRLVVGDFTPMDANFDLDLVSYQLK